MSQNTLVAVGGSASSIPPSIRMGHEPLGVCVWGGGRDVGVKAWQVLREEESEPCKVYKFTSLDIVNVLLEKKY